MTVHKVKTCACGHEEAWHAGGKGPCVYGRDHVMGGCSCPSFGRRRRPGLSVLDAMLPRPQPEADPVLRALDETIRALTGLRAALAQRTSVQAMTRAPTTSPVLNGHAPKRVQGGVREAVANARSAPSVPTKTDVIMAGGVKLRRGERRMLEVLAQHLPKKLTRAQLGTLVGIAGRGTTFGAYLGVLVRHGLVERGVDTVSLTETGAALVGPSKRSPMTRADIVAVWMKKLRAGERKMLDAVIEKGDVLRDELGVLAEIDAKGTTFGAYLGVLKRNDLVVVAGSRVRLGLALTEAR